jgi:cytochrome b
MTMVQCSGLNGKRDASFADAANDADASAGTGLRRVVVWDLATRLFHWSMALLVAATYVTWRLNWMNWHAWTGDAVLALLFFRILWGFVGSDTARFSQFVAAPRAAVRYLARILEPAPDQQAGHNAAGGWMVLLMLFLLLGQAITGIFVNNEVAVDGPLGDLVSARLANLMTDLHALFWKALLTAVGLHVSVIVFYLRVKRQNLVRPMFTGQKMLPAEVPAPRILRAGRALLALAAGTGAAVIVARFL